MAGKQQVVVDSSQGEGKREFCGGPERPRTLLMIKDLIEINDGAGFGMGVAFIGAYVREKERPDAGTAEKEGECRRGGVRCDT